jgi:hypothetical protein
LVRFHLPEVKKRSQDTDGRVINLLMELMFLVLEEEKTEMKGLTVAATEGLQTTEL